MTATMTPLMELSNDFEKDIKFSHPLTEKISKSIELDGGTLSVMVYSIESDENYDALEITAHIGETFLNEDTTITWCGTVQKSRLYGTIIHAVHTHFLPDDTPAMRLQRLAIIKLAKDICRKLPDSKYAESTYARYEVDPNAPAF